MGRGLKLVRAGRISSAKHSDPSEKKKQSILNARNLHFLVGIPSSTAGAPCRPSIASSRWWVPSPPLIAAYVSPLRDALRTFCAEKQRARFYHFRGSSSYLVQLVFEFQCNRSFGRFINWIRVWFPPTIPDSLCEFRYPYQFDWSNFEYSMPPFCFVSAPKVLEQIDGVANYLIYTTCKTVLLGHWAQCALSLYIRSGHCALKIYAMLLFTCIQYNYKDVVLLYYLCLVGFGQTWICSSLITHLFWKLNSLIESPNRKAKRRANETTTTATTHRKSWWYPK